MYAQFMQKCARTDRINDPKAKKIKEQKGIHVKRMNEG